MAKIPLIQVMTFGMIQYHFIQGWMYAIEQWLPN
jgi:hypothetical protein